MRQGVFIVGLLLSAAVWGRMPLVGASQGASITVDSSADTVAMDGECTLREAIINAEDDAATNPDCAAGAGADVVLIEADGPIHLQQPLPSVTTILRIEASGNATISGDSNDDGTPDVQILTLMAGSELTLRYLTLARGGGQLGGAINTGGGTLIAYGVTFRENRAADEQAGGAGGAIFADGGVVSLSGVMLVDNVATVGGAVHLGGGELAIFGSTFDGNAADFGAAFVAVDATVFLADTTITGGRSTGGTVELTDGSADFNNVTLLGNSSQERGTLVVGTSSAANSMAHLSLRHVLGDRNTHAGNTSGFGVDLEIDTFEATQASVSVANSLIGTCRVRARGSVTVTGSHNLSLVGGGCDANVFAEVSDFLLGPLQDNGASRLTSAPVVGSPAIGRGNADTCLHHDARGVSRPQGARCDLGPVEVTAPLADTALTATATPGAPSVGNGRTEEAARSNNWAVLGAFVAIMALGSFAARCCLRPV